MRKKLIDVIFILILTSVCVFALLGIKQYTYPIIIRYEALRLKTTLLEAAGIAYTPENLEDVFSGNIRKIEEEDLSYYLTPNDYYIFEFEGRGLWGLINGVVTLNPDFETIETIRIISQEETPGLGARITEEDYLNQFKEKKVAPQLKLIMRGKAIKHNEVDSISGASMTSQALIDMINEAVENFRKRMKT